MKVMLTCSCPLPSTFSLHLCCYPDDHWSSLRVGFIPLLSCTSASGSAAGGPCTAEARCTAVHRRRFQEHNCAHLLDALPCPATLHQSCPVPPVAAAVPPPAPAAARVVPAAPSPLVPPCPAAVAQPGTGGAGPPPLRGTSAVQGPAPTPLPARFHEQSKVSGKCKTLEKDNESACLEVALVHIRLCALCSARSSSRTATCEVLRQGTNKVAGQDRA